MRLREKFLQIHLAEMFQKPREDMGGHQALGLSGKKLSVLADRYHYKSRGNNPGRNLPTFKN